MKNIKDKKWFMPLVIVSVFMLLGVGVYFNKNNASEYINYNQFLKQVEDGQVEQVTLGEGDTITFKVANEDTLYQTENPRTLDFKENLLLQGIKVEEGNTNMTFYLVQTLVGSAIFLGIFFIVFKSMKGQRGLQPMALGIKPIEPEALKIGFNQIAGNVEAKEQVSDIVSFIKEPKQFAHFGARMPKGLIFYGPPGTGKTLMAKAIAKEAGVPFFSLSGSDFVQMYVGVGASRIRELFKEAREYEKAVIFIDEIDAIGKKRSLNPTGGNEEKDQTLNALLTEMSGFKEDSGIVVIAATNRLELLDEALLRPGRFDRHIEIGYPDQNAREMMLKLHVKDKPLSENVDLNKLARQAVYFTGAMLENLVNEAAILAAKLGCTHLEQEHFEKAFTIVIAGAEKKDTSYISSKDREITACHEAGHALVTKLIAPEQRIMKVTIVPTVKGAGGFSMSIPKDSLYMNKQDLINQIKILIAGRAAEEVTLGKDYITTGASNDIEKATAYLKDYMIKYGMDDSYGLINLKVLYEGENGKEPELLRTCKEKMDGFYKEVVELLRTHEKELKEITQELLEKENLEDGDIERIVAA